MSRTCPECNIPLTPFSFHSVALDECKQCGGIWFDDGELKRCQAAGASALVELEEEVKPEIMLLDEHDHSRNCPVCNLRLTTYKYLYTSEILLDECESCYGVWVQEGELQKMAEFLEGERAPTGDDAMLQLRAEAAGLMATMDQQTAATRTRTNRIVRFCGVLSRRPGPFAGLFG